jgi:hypothetical protein
MAGASASSVSGPSKLPLKLSLEAVVWLRSIALNASSSALALMQQAKGASGGQRQGYIAQHDGNFWRWFFL